VQKATAANMRFNNMVAGRKYNRQDCKARMWSGQDKQLSTSNLNFNKQYKLVAVVCGRMVIIPHHKALEVIRYSGATAYPLMEKKKDNANRNKIE